MGRGKQKEDIWFGKWKQQKRLDGTWQTKGRDLVWKMKAAEKARWDLANKRKIFGLEN